MGILDRFGFGRRGSMRTPLTPTEARAAGLTYTYRRQFVCGCGAQMTIRAREDRPEGLSNFQRYRPGHKLAGHATLPSSALTWNGLAEERGWNTSPIQCPACQEGVTVAVYRELRARGVR